MEHDLQVSKVEMNQIVTDDNYLHSQGAVTRPGVAGGCWYGDQRLSGERSCELSLKGVGF